MHETTLVIPVEQRVAEARGGDRRGNVIVVIVIVIIIVHGRRRTEDTSVGDNAYEGDVNGTDARDAYNEYGEEVG